MVGAQCSGLICTSLLGGDADNLTGRAQTHGTLCCVSMYKGVEVLQSELTSGWCAVEKDA